MEKQDVHKWKVPRSWARGLPGVEGLLVGATSSRPHSLGLSTHPDPNPPNNAKMVEQQETILEGPPNRSPFPWHQGCPWANHSSNIKGSQGEPWRPGGGEPFSYPTPGGFTTSASPCPHPAGGDQVGFCPSHLEAPDGSSSPISLPAPHLFSS